MSKHVMVVGIAVLFAGVSVATLYRSAQRAPSPEVIATRFVNAVATGDIPEIKKLLATTPDLVDAMFGTETALHIAARNNQTAAIELLLSKGAQLEGRGQWNGTALHWACWFGNKEAAKLLADKGLDIEDKQDIFGSTPLLWAAHGSRSVRNEKGDYVGTVEMLIERGASADTYNTQGVPAITMASGSVAAVLRAHGAKTPAPTSRAIDGLTA